MSEWANSVFSSFFVVLRRPRLRTITHCQHPLWTRHLDRRAASALRHEICFLVWFFSLLFLVINICSMSSSPPVKIACPFTNRLSFSPVESGMFLTNISIVNPQLEFFLLTDENQDACFYSDIILFLVFQFGIISFPFSLSVKVSAIAEPRCWSPSAQIHNVTESTTWKRNPKAWAVNTRQVYLDG